MTPLRDCLLRRARSGTKFNSNQLHIDPHSGPNIQKQRKKKKKVGEKLANQGLIQMAIPNGYLLGVPYLSIYLDFFEGFYVIHLLLRFFYLHN